MCHNMHLDVRRKPVRAGSPSSSVCMLETELRSPGLAARVSMLGHLTSSRFDGLKHIFRATFFIHLLCLLNLNFIDFLMILVLPFSEFYVLFLCAYICMCARLCAGGDTGVEIRPPWLYSLFHHASCSWLSARELEEILFYPPPISL